mgnify:CR=1 FL=1
MTKVKALINFVLVDRMEEFSRIAVTYFKSKFLWQRNLKKKSQLSQYSTDHEIFLDNFGSINFLSKIIFPEKYQFVRPIFDIDMFPFKIITELPSFEKF